MSHSRFTGAAFTALFDELDGILAGEASPESLAPSTNNELEGPVLDED